MDFMPRTAILRWRRGRDDLRAEAAEVGIHWIERKLAGVEVEAPFVRHLQHALMDDGVLVAGEADEAELAGLLRLDEGFVGSERKPGRRPRCG